jgi:hypothetical protein
MLKGSSLFKGGTGMLQGNGLFKGGIDWRQRFAVDVFHS